MPRSLQEIIDHAEEYADRFETYEPKPGDKLDGEAFAALRDAVTSRSGAEKAVRAAVDLARSHGYSWSLIGTLIGTSGEAARQRYGQSRTTSR